MLKPPALSPSRTMSMDEEAATCRFSNSDSLLEWLETTTSLQRMSGMLTENLRYCTLRSGRGMQTDLHSFDLCRKCCGQWEDSRMQIDSMLQLLGETLNSVSVVQSEYDALFAAHTEGQNEILALKQKVADVEGEIDTLKLRLSSATTAKNKMVVASWNRASKLTRNVTEDDDVSPVPVRSDVVARLPTGYVTFVALAVQDAAVLWRSSADVMVSAIEMLKRAVEKNLSTHNGSSLPTSDGDLMLCVFKDPVDALHFAMTLQEILLRLSWPQELLSLPQARLGYAQPDPNLGKASSTELIWRGLRVQCAIHSGYPSTSITGSGEEASTVTYQGPVLHGATSLCKAAHGGEILFSNDLFRIYRSRKTLDGAVVRCRGKMDIASLPLESFIYSVLPSSLAARGTDPSGIFSEVSSEAVTEKQKLEWWITKVAISDEVKQKTVVRLSEQERTAMQIELSKLRTDNAAITQKLAASEKEVQVLINQIRMRKPERATHRGYRDSSDSGGPRRSTAMSISSATGGTRSNTSALRGNTDAFHTLVAGGVLVPNPQPTSVGGLQPIPWRFLIPSTAIMLPILRDVEADVEPPQNTSEGALAILSMHRTVRRFFYSVCTLATLVAGKSPDWPLSVDPLHTWLPIGSSLSSACFTGAFDGGDPWLSVNALATLPTLDSKENEAAAFAEKDWSGMSRSLTGFLARLQVLIREHWNRHFSEGPPLNLEASHSSAASLKSVAEDSLQTYEVPDLIEKPNTRQPKTVNVRIPKSTKLPVLTTPSSATSPRK